MRTALPLILVVAGALLIRSAFAPDPHPGRVLAGYLGYDVGPTEGDPGTGRPPIHFPGVA